MKYIAINGININTKGLYIKAFFISNLNKLLNNLVVPQPGHNKPVISLKKHISLISYIFISNIKIIKKANILTKIMPSFLLLSICSFCNFI